MKRREFIALLGGAATGRPWAAWAQQAGATRRVGVLMSNADNPEGQDRLAGFRRGLQEKGWIDGRNAHIDYRWTNADAERAQTYAAELIDLTPDVILAHAPQALRALREKTQSIPIVFVQVPEPVKSGFVASLARPGGNITGFPHFEREMSGKWLSLLKEAAPHVTRVLSIESPVGPWEAGYFDGMVGAADLLRVQLIRGVTRDAPDIERTIEDFAREPNGGLVALPDILTSVHRSSIIALAAHHRLPAIYPFRFFAVEGGLMSYGVDLNDLFYRSASYVDRILRGEKPSDLPVQNPTKYQLAINLKTAKALGLEVPSSFYWRADEVIE